MRCEKILFTELKLSIMKNLFSILIIILIVSPVLAQQHSHQLLQENHKCYINFFNDDYCSMDNFQNLSFADKMNFRLTNPAKAKTDIIGDSAIYTDESGKYKEKYTHDDNSSFLTVFTQKWFGTFWMNSTLVTNTYTDFGMLHTVLRQDWENNNWVNSTLSTYSYDDNEDKISHLRQSWINENWINTNLISYTYDVNENLINFLGQLWETNTWKNNMQIILAYDENGYCYSEVFQNWENSKWENDWQSNMTYDAVGNKLTMQFEDWENNEWLKRVLFTATYDSSGNNLTLLNQDWENPTWINSTFVTYTYNQNDHKLTELVQFWENNAWMNLILSKNTFDENENMVKELRQDWDNYYGWTYKNKTEYIFTTGHINATVYKDSLGSWVENIWGSLLNITLEGERLNYDYVAINLDLYYSELVNTEEQDYSINDSPILCYPNPATNELTFELIPDWQNTPLQIELFNQAGQKVKSIEFSENSSTEFLHFSVENLPGGLYMLYLINGKEAFSQKILISE